jgi:hypothetical protein
MKQLQSYSKLSEKLEPMLEEVKNIDPDKYPFATKIINIPIDYWREYKREIIKQILRVPNIKINIRGGMGGGLSSENYTISISPGKDLPAVPEEEMEKNIDEILELEIVM